VHRWSILIIVHQDATQSSLFIILQVHSTCFGCQPHPSSGVHKTATTASGTGHIFCAVLCIPDEGRGWHPKHMEWTCRIINRLLCVAFHGTIIYIFQNFSRNLVDKLAWPRWREVTAQKIRPPPEDAVTVLCTPDDRCGWHPKHVEWTCRIINRLLCVASRWTVINIFQNLIMRVISTNTVRNRR